MTEGTKIIEGKKVSWGNNSASLQFPIYLGYFWLNFVFEDERLLLHETVVADFKIPHFVSDPLKNVSDPKILTIQSTYFALLEIDFSFYILQTNNLNLNFEIKGIISKQLEPTFIHHFINTV